MSDVLYGFDSGMSLSFVHDRIGRAVSGLLTGGPTGAITSFFGGGNGTTGSTVPGATTDRCGNPLFRPGEPTSVSEARFRCANPVRVSVTPGAILPGGEPFIAVGRGPGAVAPPVAAGAGFVAPVRSSVAVDKCPRFADGATGILWMSALTGEVVCLPRRANGTAFGLIRKNKPRRKPFISAAQKKQLDAISKVQNKAKAFATAAGFKCVNTKQRVPGTPRKKS